MNGHGPIRLPEDESVEAFAQLNIPENAITKMEKRGFVWINCLQNTTVDQIAETCNLTPMQTLKLRKAVDAWQNGDCVVPNLRDDEDNPSPEDIRNFCEGLQEEWSDADRLRRMDITAEMQREMHVTAPELHSDRRRKQNPLSK